MSNTASETALINPSKYQRLVVINGINHVKYRSEKQRPTSHTDLNNISDKELFDKMLAPGWHPLAFQLNNVAKFLWYSVHLQQLTR